MLVRRFQPLGDGGGQACPPYRGVLLPVVINCDFRRLCYIQRMTTKLTQAVAAVERLPQKRQDELAEAILETATRSLVDGKIDTGEASHAAHGGKPMREVFARRISKYTG